MSLFSVLFPSAQKQLNQIEMNATQLEQQLKDTKAQFDKASAEIKTRVKALEDAIAANTGEVPQAVVDAANALKDTAQGFDDLNADAVETGDASGGVH